VVVVNRKRDENKWEEMNKINEKINAEIESAKIKSNLELAKINESIYYSKKNKFNSGTTNKIRNW
jgi:hypothetical protein